MQASVLGLVNHPHPAATELFDNAVMRNCLVDHRRESYLSETVKSMNVERLVRPLAWGGSRVVVGENALISPTSKQTPFVYRRIAA